ncbi:TlpA family protein disulfide reductase [Microbulbifer flavimaris]|uniref:TlpA family protein disulfide reductase n=1 Tax=Microbulbifer flavimaris TaxID=1781068 RepID=A0ABX4I032_9GAMM|nr:MULTISPECIES: TlpA disulfide reductase family protein [Microbulbifer]KUJ83522.1 alkyl hydroperoxide reductase [Microbulbifer sp. ZGT114]PCO05681.1 TlpA family protein disulfide reductase [Microbulbifer flavimaris]
MNFPAAPEITAAAWLNVDVPLSMQALQGNVVMLHAFQMLCPACVSQATPQAAAVAECFAGDDFQLIGLHTVFEHHSVMTPDALRVYAAEFRLQFPIAIDQPAENGPVPVTMAKLGLQGTPSTVLVDRAGNIRFSHFGTLSDMQLGAMVGQLLSM